MKKRILAVLLSFCIMSGSVLCPAMVQAEGVETGASASEDVLDSDGLDAEHNTQEPVSGESQEDDTGQEKEKSVVKAVFCAGSKGTLGIENARGAVKWSVGDKDILQIVKKTNKICRVRALKDGKTYVRATAKNITVTYKVSVKSGKAFVRAWCRLWAETHITDDMGYKDKLIIASSYITTFGTFSSGDTGDPLDLLTKGYGNCVAGGKLLVSMCQAMGFDAKLRFAAKDDMSRYPQGVVFASQHYNVEVMVNGRKYYIDGMPGSGFTYLSTARKPIYYAILGMGVPV